MLETGKDLRYVSRPILGIYVDKFTPEIAQKLGVPASTGTRLSEVAPGMGAEQAGLQKDDVIVSLAGQPAGDYPSLVAALGPRAVSAGLPISSTLSRIGLVCECRLSL